MLQFWDTVSINVAVLVHVDLLRAEKSLNLISSIRKLGKLLSERCAFKQGDAVSTAGLRQDFLECAGEPVVVRAAKKDLSAVVVVDMELEMLCEW